MVARLGLAMFLVGGPQQGLVETIPVRLQMGKPCASKRSTLVSGVPISETGTTGDPVTLRSRPASLRLQIDQPSAQLNHLARHKDRSCIVDAQAQRGRAARQFALRNGFNER